MKKPAKKTILILTGIAAPVAAPAVLLPKLARRRKARKYARM